MLSRQEIIEKLRDTQLQNYLKNKGIEHLSLFGSYARDEAKSDSDLDLLIDIRSWAIVTLFTLSDIEDKFQSDFNIPRVDFVTTRSLNPRLKPYIESDIINIF